MEHEGARLSQPSARSHKRSESLHDAKARIKLQWPDVRKMFDEHATLAVPIREESLEPSRGSDARCGCSTQ